MLEYVSVLRMLVFFTRKIENRYMFLGIEQLPCHFKTCVFEIVTSLDFPGRTKIDS